jgi:hypothetical protein
MADDNEDLVPQKQSLFPMTAEDIVDNALANLDEEQAKAVTRKAADEVIKIAVEKRKAEYRSDRAQDEMRELINNANLLDEKVGDYKINSTFETATGTTSVEIRKSRTTTIALMAAIGIAVLVVLVFVLTKL